MAIIVENMNMPNTCTMCWLSNICQDHIHDLTHIGYDKRLDDCPLRELVRCEECIHAKQHSYAPAECQWYCTLSLQYHSGRFFCACGERGTNLLEWLHGGDDDE